MHTITLEKGLATFLDGLHGNEFIPIKSSVARG
jgi:hypothetical protein